MATESRRSSGRAAANLATADSESPQPGSVLLVRGDDPPLLAGSVRALIHAAVGDEDLSLGLDDFASPDFELAAAVDAAQTPPMFTSMRVVVVRDIGRFNTDQAEPLLTYLAAPCPTTVMLLVGGGGQISRKVLDAVKRVGRVVETGVPTGKARQQWLADRLAASPVRLDQRAVMRLFEHLGEDIGRVDGVLSVLDAVFGGARISADDLEPFLGAAGSGAPWDLTDAIDRGDAAAALGHLTRLQAGGDRHPLQIMATLQIHFGRMLRLDGSGARDETEAAGMLGITGSPFPAKKALTQARRLGSSAIARAIRLLADADLDLRGVRDVPGEIVLDVLVARLSRLAPRR